MSRTDKDKPYWVQAEWWEPSHFCNQHHARSLQKGTEKCDLPNEPKVQEFRPMWRKPVTRCIWVPVDPTRKWWQTSPPKWYVDHVWWNPQRVQERDILRDAKKDWHANGDTDIEVCNYQTKNCANWYYW